MAGGERKRAVAKPLENKGKIGVGKKVVDEDRGRDAKNRAVTPGGAMGLGKRWYVAQVNRGRERFVQRELYHLLHCAVPLVNGQVLFADYVFLKMDLERDPWQRVNYTRGVKGLLFGEKPVPIPEREDIVKLLECRSERNANKLVRGMLVKVQQGPFDTLIGTVNDVRGDIVHLILGSLPVSMPVNYVITCTHNLDNNH